MPDLSIEIQFICDSNRDWATTVELTPGHKYKVIFGRMDGGPYPYGYQCECKAFRYGKGKNCKHIKHVLAKHLRCGWQGGTPAEKDGEYICPECGDTASPIRVAV